jgi:hypothetical protein
MEEEILVECHVVEAHMVVNLANLRVHLLAILPRKRESQVTRHKSST